MVWLWHQLAGQEPVITTEHPPALRYVAYIANIISNKGDDSRAVA